MILGERLSCAVPVDNFPPEITVFDLAHLALFAFLAVMALQFSDAIGQYKLLSAGADCASSWMKQLVEKFGLAPTIITTKVVILSAVAALYFLTSLPFWLWLAAAAYYLYRTGKWVFIWAVIKKGAN